MMLSSSQSHSAEGGGDYYYYKHNTRQSSTLADDWVVPQSTGVLKADFLPPGYVHGYGQKMEMNQDYSATPASAGGDIIISSTLPSSSYAATSLLPTVSPHVSAPTSHGLPDSTPLTQKPKRRRKGPQKTPGKTAKNKERHFVQHNYHDLATEPDSIIGSDHESSSGLSDDAFPMRLHRMLDEVDKEGYAHIISWQPHGRAFIIRDTCLFSQIIMPKYFPTSKKITSIQRQFNLYGFEKLTRDGPDQGAYYHEAFLRGKPELSSRRMVRKRVKGTGHKACSNPDAEPDFYSMPFVAVSGCGSSNSVNGTISQASAAPTLDGMRSSVTSEESDDYYYYQGSLNQQQQQVQPLFTSSQQMFQSYSAPTSRNGTLQHQKNTYTCTRSTTEEIDDEPIDLFHFDWGDAEMFRS